MSLYTIVIFEARERPTARIREYVHGMRPTFSEDRACASVTRRMGDRWSSLIAMAAGREILVKLFLASDRSDSVQDRLS